MSKYLIVVLVVLFSGLACANELLEIPGKLVKYLPQEAKIVIRDDSNETQDAGVAYKIHTLRLDEYQYMPRLIDMLQYQSDPRMKSTFIALLRRIIKTVWMKKAQELKK